MLYEYLLLALVVVAALPYVLFTVTFAARSTWWRTTSGRALMISTPAVAFLLLSELVLALFPVSYRAELLITVVSLTLIAVGGWLKFGSLVHELRHGGKR